jgi:hypothetical protein
MDELLRLRPDPYCCSSRRRESNACNRARRKVSRLSAAVLCAKTMSEIRTFSPNRWARSIPMTGAEQAMGSNP